MRNLGDIKLAVRKKNKPEYMSKLEWANSINWTIEAWKCYVHGQKWIHDFVITCPEQYFLLLDAKGNLFCRN